MERPIVGMVETYGYGGSPDMSDKVTAWRWLDTGSGPGAMVPVRVAVADMAVRTAYAAWLDHAVSCDDCRTSHPCDDAAALWSAYRTEARS